MKKQLLIVFVVSLLAVLIVAQASFAWGGPGRVNTRYPVVNACLLRAPVRDCPEGQVLYIKTCTCTKSSIPDRIELPTSMFTPSISRTTSSFHWLKRW